MHALLRHPEVVCKDELVGAMAELTNHEFENPVEAITSTDDRMLPSPYQSRQSDPTNGAMGDPPVNSCDTHDSRTNVPPDKSVNPMQPLILSEPSTSVLGRFQKSSVATAIDTGSYRCQSSNAPTTFNPKPEEVTLQKSTTLDYFQRSDSDFNLVDLGSATLEISSDLNKPSCGMIMSPDKTPATSDHPKAGNG